MIRRILPAIGLFFLAPLIAEYLLARTVVRRILDTYWQCGSRSGVDLAARSRVRASTTPPGSPGFQPQSADEAPDTFRYNLVLHSIAPLAQLDRASGYEPEGREFESLRAHHTFKHLPENRKTDLGANQHA